MKEEFNNYESMKLMLESQLQLITRIENVSAESEKNAKRSKRSEKVVFKVANLVIDKYENIIFKENLEDWESDIISELINDKATEITRIIYPSLNPVRKRGEMYLKEWIKVNKGLYSIYKKNVNGHKGSYKHTKRIKFAAAKEYIRSLSYYDYECLREGNLRSIRKFEFQEPVLEERLDIEKLINDEIDKEEMQQGLLQ